MKRILVLLTMFIFLIFSAGCSSDKGGFSFGTDKSNKQITMGFSQLGAESSWRAAHTKDIKDAAERAGVKLIFSDGQQKQENQIKAIRSFISQGVDVIAFTPIAETGWDAVLKEAKAAKIPVIVVDRDVKLNDDSLYVAKIGTDSITEGQNAFKWVDEYVHKVNKKPRDGGDKFNIAIIEGDSGSSVTTRRSQGFNEAMQASPNSGQYQIITSQTGEFTRKDGQEVMAANLRAYGNKIDILFSENDDMALGAIAAIEAAGLQPGKDITIVSIDGVKDIFQAMIEGKSNCTVECNPLQGDLLMETAKKILNKEKVSKDVFVKEGVFPADIAAKTLPDRKY